jgi:hypothetical protein
MLGPLAMSSFRGVIAIEGMFCYKAQCKKEILMFETFYHHRRRCNEKQTINQAKLSIVP